MNFELDAKNMLKKSRSVIQVLKATFTSCRLVEHLDCFTMELLYGKNKTLSR